MRKKRPARKLIHQKELFANHFHLYSHLTPRDIQRICARAGVLNRTLHQLLNEAFSACRTFASSRRPLAWRKVSFSQLMQDFTHRLHIDLRFIAEPGKCPILHMKYAATGFSAATLRSSQFVKEASKCLMVHWISFSEPTFQLPADLEFFKEKFLAMCAPHDIRFQRRTNRRHNKLGIAE